MFSPDIVCSDAFLDMPSSTQALYFHLGMIADDDGFVNPKRAIRNVGASDDDLKVLLAKRFLLAFKDGVVVIKHWLIHNLIRADRYKPTRYLEHKNTLFIKENKAYTELATNGLQSVNQMAPQVRLGKVRIESTLSKESDTPILEVRLDNEGKERPQKKKREADPAWPLFQKATEMLSKQAGFPVLTAEKDFVRLREAMKSLKEKDLLELVEAEIESGWADKVGYSLAAILTNSRINKYKSDWNV